MPRNSVHTILQSETAKNIQGVSKKDKKITIRIDIKKIDALRALLGLPVKLKRI